MRSKLPGMPLPKAIVLDMQPQAAEEALLIQVSLESDIELAKQMECDERLALGLDFDLAEQMQLDEVLAASIGTALASPESLAECSGASQRQDEGCSSGIEPRDGVSAPLDDLSTLSYEHLLDSDKLKQELDNRLEAMKLQMRQVEIYDMYEHDRRFAGFLFSLSEREWEYGQYLDDPYTTFDPDDVCKAVAEYLTSRSEVPPVLERTAPAEYTSCISEERAELEWTAPLEDSDACSLRGVSQNERNPAFESLSVEVLEDMSYSPSIFTYTSASLVLVILIFCSLFADYCLKC